MFEFLKSYLPDSKYPVNKTGEDDQIEDLLYYQIMGCMYVCKKHINMPDEEWMHVKCNIDQFLKNGFDKLV